MKIILAKTAGFCMGVRRAVEMVLEASNKEEKPVYTYGPLIHNPQVLDILNNKGIKVLSEIPKTGKGTVLIRAHGVPPESMQSFKDAGFNVIDATCPRVIKVQTIIDKYARQGYTTIIIGDKDHPEVKGLLGFAKNKGHAVDCLEDLQKLPVFEKAIVVAQTTQDNEYFGQARDFIEKKCPDYKIFNTICDSTAKRQAEVKKIADEVESVVVVGGHNSGNTKRLAQILQNKGVQAYHVETEIELDVNQLRNQNKIGITAGASTPNWIINRVYNYIEMMPTNRMGKFRKLLFTIQHFLLMTNLYVALGAGCLAFACMTLQDIKPTIPLVLMSFLYVLSMHNLNFIINRKSEKYNYPYKSAFYEKHKKLLLLIAFFSGFLGILIAFFQGTGSFIILSIMSTLGLAYRIKIVPVSLKKNFKVISIQDLPGSKTILIALAWGIVTTLLPAISVKEKILPVTLTVFCWSAALVFVRTAFFDMLDMQGDRIVGRETLALLLGEKKTINLLKIILGILFLGSIFSSISGLTNPLSILLSLCIVFMGTIIYAHEKGHMLPGFRMEFLIESLFVLTGIISFCWWVIT